MWLNGEFIFEPILFLNSVEYYNAIGLLVYWYCMSGKKKLLI